MTKFKHKTLSDSLPSNTYITSKNNSYVFDINIATSITDKDDIQYFRDSSDFEEIGIVEQAKEKVKEKIKEITTPKGKEQFKKTLIDLKGIDEEIAEVILNDYDSFDEFKKISERDLIRISGIGRVRADRILKQLRGE